MECCRRILSCERELLRVGFQRDVSRLIFQFCIQIQVSAYDTLSFQEYCDHIPFTLPGFEISAYGLQMDSIIESLQISTRLKNLTIKNVSISVDDIQKLANVVNARDEMRLSFQNVGVR